MVATMDPIEINNMLRRRPFGPFRIHTSDGNHVDSWHPEFAFVTETSLHVGFPVKDPLTELPRRAQILSPINIVRLEPLEPAAT